MAKLKAHAKPQKLKSKTKLKSQSRSDEKWTANTWYVLAGWYEQMSCDRSLPKELREKFDAEAEAAWVTGDLMRGVTPEMWDDTCRKQVEAEEARRRGEDVKGPLDLENETYMAKRANYSVRERSEKKPAKTKSKSARSTTQLEMALA